MATEIDYVIWLLGKPNRSALLALAFGLGLAKQICRVGVRSLPSH